MRRFIQRMRANSELACSPSTDRPKVVKTVWELADRMDQNWRVVRSEMLLKDRWVELRADDCVTSAGIKIGPYYVLSYPDWVHVVALTSASSLILVRQYRHAVGDCTLELPGGAVDGGRQR